MGLRHLRVSSILLGCLVLAAYGITVNLLRWDFSKLLGVYVSFFALLSVLTGRILFHESIPLSTWLGVAAIMAGGLLIQFGPR